MIELSQVLQRVRIVATDRDGHPVERRLPIGVRHVMDKLGAAVIREHEHRPILISTRELARRIGHDDAEAKSTRRGLQTAERLGLIRRQPPVNQLGAHAPWPIWLHPALLAASKSSRAWAGGTIVYPRDWTDADPGKPPSVHLVTRPAFSAPPAVLAGRKVTKTRDHSPPPARVDAAAVPGGGTCPGPILVINSDGLGFPAPTGGGGSGDRQQTTGGDMGSSIDGGGEFEFGPGARVRSLAALAAFAGGRARQQAPARPSEGCAYWAWLVASASAAGWRQKGDGWTGAKSGDLKFVMQARRKSDGLRGGPFRPTVVRLSDAATGATTALDMAEALARHGRLPEPTFCALGDTPLLLVDDLTPDHLELFSGWQGVAVIETSPGSLQASMMAPRPLRSFEALAANRALARRCGLTFAAVQQGQLRRFVGSVNHKPGLLAPFVSRLFCEPVVGTISEQQLAELLADEAAHAAADNTPVAAQRTVRMPTPASDSGASTPSATRVRDDASRDHTGSGQDWAWVMLELGRVGGGNRGRLVAALEKRAGARRRQGKPPSDPDHLRYAELTVDRAFAHRAARIDA